jgi:peptide/nickel transport system substrate-binding protein/microcin C transport system substrate-binding protein
VRAARNVVPGTSARPRAPVRTRALLALALSLAMGGPATAAGPATERSPSPAQPASATAAANSGHWVHAYAAFGEPKYPRGFDHFEYLNPNAPKGGTLYLPNPDRRTSFDKLNYYTVKGNAPAGVALFMIESLAFLGADELQTMYGLLAEEMLVAPDKSSITFRLHPKARFSNGDPVTSEDVKHSFDTLTSQYVSPNYPTDYAGVERAVVVDARTIRFDLREKTSDQMFKLGRLPVFSHKYGLKADGSRPPFDQIVDELPIGSGPYTIARMDSGRRIEFQRNPDYWARDLPVRRGMYNFDRIVYRYYQDEDIAIEAFKAGEYDIVRMYSAAIWTRQLRGPKFDSGQIVKRAIHVGTGQGLQAYELNLRRSIFQDIRVRHALVLTYDWETNNRYRDFGLKRASSVFNNSEFAAVGLPSPGELKLLEPFRDRIPKEVFGPPFVAPRTDTGPHALRRNLLEARTLLEAAGWKLAADGVLRNAKGEPFVVELLAPSSQDTDRRMLPWGRNGAKLGMTIRARRVDFALFNRRLEEFDFDMVTIVEPAFQLPAVADYLSLYGSKAADEKGSGNFRGVKSAAADHILAAMANAATLDDFRDACRAFDRLVMWSYWQVPELYSDDERLAYWTKFGIPAVQPLHFTTDLSPDVDSRMPWPITSWWSKDAEKR